jgi:hypothetical protein
MQDTKKSHAHDYLIPFSEKDNTPMWLRILIKTAIDSNGVIDEEIQESIFQELLKEYKIANTQTDIELDHEDKDNELTFPDLKVGGSFC